MTRLQFLRPDAEDNAPIGTAPKPVTIEARTLPPSVRGPTTAEILDSMTGRRYIVRNIEPMVVPTLKSLARSGALPDEDTVVRALRTYAAQILEQEVE